MKKKDITPLESLERVKLMMGYDMSKTLTENRVVINEQDKVDIFKLNELSNQIFEDLSGDVKVEDLIKVKKILEEKIFGKLDDKGECAYKKLNEYYGGVVKYKMGRFLGPMRSLNFTKRYNDIIADLKNTGERSEQHFEQVKEELITSIENEINTFCKTKSSTSTTQNTNVDEWKSKFSCLFTINGATKNEVKIDTKNNQFLIIYGESDNIITQYRLYKDGKVYNYNTLDYLGIASCSNNQFIVEGSQKSKKLLEQFNDKKLRQSQQQKSQQQSQQQQSQQQSQQQTTNKILPIPRKLVNSAGVRKFQEWVYDIEPEILGRFGVDGKYGNFTKNAWEKYGQEYLSELSGGSTSSTSTTSTQSQPTSTTQGITPQPGGGVKTATLDPSEYE